MTAQPDIAQRVVDAILAQKLKPGERLGEQELADLFEVSRTLVREALMQLQARGFVEVHSRKGWYVVEPSIDEARDAFAARRAVEAGMLRSADLGDLGRPLQSVMRKLRAHLKDERAAIAAADSATRAFLLADFHVCLAECLGHRLLSDILRDLTARTMLVATLYQSTHNARRSCAEHVAIVDAIENGELDHAAEMMLTHIGSVEDALGASAGATVDARERLRATLAPLVNPAVTRLARA